MDASQEVSGSLVVACCNCTKVLEFGKEVLDQVPCFVDIPIVVPAHFAVGFWRDDNGLVLSREQVDDALIGVESLVGDQQIGRHARQ